MSDADRTKHPFGRTRDNDLHHHDPENPPF
jgi:hypothetical protein